MQTFLYHVQINVSDAGRSIPFYRALFAYLEYTTVMETHDLLGVSNGTTDFWMIETPAERRPAAFHRKNTGLNHVAFGVGRREAVDRFVEDFLRPRGIAPLYDSPRELLHPRGVHPHPAGHRDRGRADPRHPGTEAGLS